VDDSAFECTEVHTAHPEVLVLELPEDRSQHGEFLKHVWELDRFSATSEDRERTRMYQQEVQRERLRASLTLEEFLEKMEIEVTVRPAGRDDVPRIAQMTKRTNQFNTTTLRETEATVDQWLVDDARSSIVVNVRDRFGDYGLVGFVGIQWHAGVAVIDRFLLSCRALGRNVEHHILARVGHTALERGVPWIELRFAPTPKNEPARTFLDSLGSDVTSDAEGHASYRLSSAAATQVHAHRGASSHQAIPSPAQLVPVVLSPVEPAPLRQFSRARSSVTEIRVAIESAERKLAQPYVEPANRLQRLISELWAKLLKLDKVGIDDDLFDLGADSITFVLASSSLSEALGVEAPVSLLFDAPTVAQQAAALAGIAGNLAGDDAARPLRHASEAG
jgi:acyl carrier protein